MVENNTSVVKENEQLAKFLKLLREQVTFHKDKALAFSSTPRRHKKHWDTAKGLEEILSYIYILEISKEPARQDTGSTPPKQLRLTLTPTDLEGLPDEQIAELNISSVDRVEFDILNLLEDSGGIMTLDQILIGLYRKTQAVQKRQTITSRIYRMGQKNLIYSVPRRKGVYSSRRISEEEALELFGRSAEEESSSADSTGEPPMRA
ncbi:MAG: hypothetical protein ACR2KU_02415 [Gammaproteobacteria bacterium]